LTDDEKNQPTGDEPAAAEGAEADEPVVVDDEQDGDEVVQDPSERIAELEERLAAEHDRLLRTAADLDNLRKRMRREVQEAAVRGRAEVLGELLPAVDSLDIALDSANEESQVGPVLEGVEMVRKQFLAAMSRFDLEPIDTAVGKVFDPSFHEAVSQIPSDEHDLGVILEEMRRGYLLGERLLRAAMVVVSSGKPAAEETGDEGPDEAAGEAAGEVEETDE
jgi:molecular chaperone GrpE